MLPNANKPLSRYVKLAIEGIKQHIDEYPMQYRMDFNIISLLTLDK